MKDSQAGRSRHSDGTDRAVQRRREDATLDGRLLCRTTSGGLIYRLLHRKGKCRARPEQRPGPSEPQTVPVDSWSGATTPAAARPCTNQAHRNHNDDHRAAPHQRRRPPPPPNPSIPPAVTTRASGPLPSHRHRRPRQPKLRPPPHTAGTEARAPSIPHPPPCSISHSGKAATRRDAHRPSHRPP